MKKIKLTAYTDAASYNNGKKIPYLPEHSGSAGVILYQDTIIIGKSMYNPNSSISFGELYAIYMILKEVYNLAVDSYKLIDLVLYSDSAYCVQSINDWMRGWKARSKGGVWTNASNDRVAYQSLFMAIDDLLNETDYLKVKIKHISGHIDMSKNSHVAKATTRYKRFNKESITPEELKRHTKFNDLCDRYAKDTLRIGMEGGVLCERNRDVFEKY